MAGRRRTTPLSRSALHITLSGKDEVLKKLGREIAGIKTRSRSALRRVALIVLRDSKNMTPVDTGNLVNSAYHIIFEGVLGLIAEIGYTAAYAIFVHERNLAYRSGRWKFLETALKKNARAIVSILRDSARV